MDIVGIIKTILALGLLGFLVWLIVTKIPMPDIFKTVIQVVVAVLVILWLLSLLSGQGVLNLR